MKRDLSIQTPLGEKKFSLRNFSYSEELGRPFHLEAELVSEDHEFKFEQLVGERVTIGLALANGKNRCFHGIVASLSQNRSSGRFASYQATVVPWLWLLTRTADCRIFQQKTVPDIIKEVCREYGFSDLADQLKGTYKPWTYCVQYRESDFNFVSRLMEQEGIYYYWKHEQSKHTLVLVDDATAHDPVPGYENIKFHPEQPGYTGAEEISNWTVRKEVQPMIYALQDFNFEKPQNSLLAKSSQPRQHSGPQWEIFDYPGEYDQSGEGDTYSKIRIQELQSQYEIANGESEARGISAGHVFTLEKHPRQDQNRTYLVTACHYSAASEEYESGAGSTLSVRCAFQAIDAQQQFRLPRTTPKPLVQGPQTAVVVGPKGEEIYVDEYGRVKVMFHWDRYAKADETSSCWIRVSQAWAGKQWGAFYVPRIGQEVIVEFLEGDPDQPIITGSVYNGDNKPPYDLPAEKTKSTLKSLSSKGGAGFNEIRFEDKKGDEQIFIHAEKDQEIRIKNDAKQTVGNELHLLIKKDQLEKVEGDQHSTVKGDSYFKTEGDANHTIKGCRLVAIDGEDHLTVKGDQDQEIKGDANVKVGMNHNQEAGQTISIKAGTDLHQKVSQHYALDAGMAVHIKGGTKVVIESGMQISLKAGSNFIDIGPAGISIKGTMVNINSSGSAASGDGCSPKEPALPQSPTPPKDPKEATDAKSGQVEQPPKANASSSNSQAAVLKQAAASGQPFCPT